MVAPQRPALATTLAEFNGTRNIKGPKWQQGESPGLVRLENHPFCHTRPCGKEEA